MHHASRPPLILLALCLVAGAVGAANVGADVTALTQALVTDSVAVGEPFTLTGTITYASTGAPVPGARVVLQQKTPSGAWADIDSTLTAADGTYTFTRTIAVAGTYEFNTLVNGQVLSDGWLVTVGPGGTPTAVPPTVPTGVPGGATYAQARAAYIAAASAWSQAWGASEMALIRQYLNQAKAAYTTSLNAANQVVDPANAANLALVRSVSRAYVDLADAAIAMYDGADLFGAGRSQMNTGAYPAAAASFGSAAEKFTPSQTLFVGATATLQGVSYAGTEYGDGTAYTAVIVPLLNGKAAYMGEYAAYARGWQHTALAYQASANGDVATFRSEATQAMTLFAGLQSSPSFGANALSNYNVLASMLGGAAPAPSTTTPTPTPTQTAAPSARPETGTWILQGALSGSGNSLSVDNQNDYDAVITLRREATPPESGARFFSYYLRAHDSHSVQGIPAGRYTLWYKLGEFWNPTTSSFTLDHSARRFEEALTYDASGSRRYEATIYPVVGGNAPTEPVSPDLV